MNEYPIEIDVRLDQKDLLRANYWFFFHKFKRLIFVLVLVGVLLPALYLSRWLSQEQSNSAQFPWMVLIPGFALVILLLSPYIASRKALASNKILNEGIRYSFSQAGIDAVSPLSTAHLEWQTVPRAVETKHAVLLFIGPNQMFVIPTRCFGGEGQLTTLRALLRDRLGQTASSSDSEAG